MVEVNSKCPKCGEGIMKLQTEHTQLPRTDLLGRARRTLLLTVESWPAIVNDDFPAARLTRIQKRPEFK